MLLAVYTVIGEMQNEFGRPSGVLELRALVLLWSFTGGTRKATGVVGVGSSGPPSLTAITEGSPDSRTGGGTKEDDGDGKDGGACASTDNKSFGLAIMGNKLLL